MRSVMPDTLAARIWRLAAVAAAAIVVLSGATYWQIQDTQQADAQVTRSLQVLRQINRLRQSASQAESAHRGYVLTGRQNYLAEYEQAAALARDRPHGLGLSLKNAAQEAHVRDLAHALWQKLRLADHVNLLVQDRRQEEAVVIAASEDAAARSQRLYTAGEALADIERVELEAGRLEAEAARNRFLLVSALCVLVLLVGVPLIAGSIIRTLRRQLGSLTGAISKMAAGDLNAQAEVHGDDEIGRVAAAFNEMSRRALSAGREVEEAHGKLLEASAELRAHSNGIDLLGKMAHRLNVARDEGEFAEILAKIVPGILPGMIGGLYFFNNSRNLLVLTASWGGGEFSEHFDRDDCWALRRGQAHVVPSSDEDVVCTHLRVVSDGTSYTCIPLLARGETVGLLYLRWEPGLKYDTERVDTVAETIASALVNHRLRESLRQQSVRDPLTGLFNRRYLEEALQIEIARAERSGPLRADRSRYRSLQALQRHSRAQSR